CSSWCRCWRRRGCRTRCSRAVPAAGVQLQEIFISAAPDDHFTASPDCRVRDSGGRGVGGGRGYPTISAGTISPAGVKWERGNLISTPDDHLTAGPHCCVIAAGIGRVRGSGGGATSVGVFVCADRGGHRG